MKYQEMTDIINKIKAHENNIATLKNKSGSYYINLVYDESLIRPFTSMLIEYFENRIKALKDKAGLE